MKKNKPNLKSLKTNKKIPWVKIGIVALILIVGLVAVWFLIFSPSSGKTGCVVGNSSKIRATAPTVAHMYGGEILNYPLLESGSYAPANEVIKQTINGHSYELKVAFDVDSISPSLGSSVHGSIQLMRDGKSITNIPKDENGRLEISIPEVYVKVLGISGQQIRSGTLSVYSRANPYPINQIISPQGTSEYSETERSRNTIDLSRGKAEFDFYYFGGRISPYVSLSFEEGGMKTTKVLCFEDQTTTRISYPDLNQQNKGEFYYDVKVSPSSVTSGHQQRIKIDITSKNSETNRVNKNPYQRINIWTYPISNIQAPRTNHVGEIIGYNQSVRGGFVIYDEDNNKITKLLAKQAADGERTSRLSGSQNQPIDNINIDLIDGKGTVYFEFDGIDSIPSTPLSFVIQPTNFDVKPGIVDSDMVSNRIEKNIENPQKPSDFIQNNPQGNQNLRPGQSSSTLSFLYGSWMEDDSIKYGIYTVKSLSIGGVRISLEPNAWFWLIVSQISKLIFAGGLIWFLRKKRKTQK